MQLVLIYVSGKLCYSVGATKKIVTKDVGAPPVDVARELIWVKTNRTKRDEVYAHEKEIETREKAFQVKL